MARIVIEFDDGTSSYHQIQSQRTVSVEEGRNMIRIYDTSGQRTFVAAYNASNVRSMRWAV